MKEEEEVNSRYYVGIDLSTQAIKATVLNSILELVYETSCPFETTFPKYRAQNGVHQNGNEVTSPTLMWIEAIDFLFTDLQKNIDTSKIKAISGAGQQHGSVYWKKGSEKNLSSLNPELSLVEQLKNCFSIFDSPIWMDSSTTSYCKKLEKQFGGPEKIALMTGSRAYERFTGNQIAKIIETKPNEYLDCERISLVSSFVASILTGKYTGIDHADGAGMNLMDIRTKQWNQQILESISKDLEKKLGDLSSSDLPLGNVSQYFSKFGLPNDCLIITFTGDNPSSLAGMALKQGELAISLGTSDTIFLSLSDVEPNIESTILRNPIETDSFMGMLCFKNGSLTREWARDTFANSSWNSFSNFLDSSPPGLHGKIGLYYRITEITPSIEPQIHRFDSFGNEIDSFKDPKFEIRALIESHFISMRLHSESMGMKLPSKLIVTGGASKNKSILQVLSDVFGVPVYASKSISNSASLGGAYRAFHGWKNTKEKLSFFQIFTDKSFGPQLILEAEPRQDYYQLYTQMIPKIQDLEKKFTTNN